MRFTEWATPGNKNLFESRAYTNSILSLTDCQLHGGHVYFERGLITITNCLFDRTSGYFEDWGDYADFRAHLHNNLFRGAYQELLHYGSATWTLSDNLFDDTLIGQDGYLTNSHNAYTTNATRLLPTTTGDVVLAVTNFIYDTGPLGRFYLPPGSSLLNAGSTWAMNVGLYHFSTVASQAKEAASQVDISFHYAALSGSSAGSPATDNESDSYFDYAEDTNGNGSFDAGAGETDWTAYNSRLGIDSGPGLVVFTPLK